MEPASLSIDGQKGFVFEGKIPGTVVYVPLNCVTQVGSGWIIDHTRYLLSGWAEKNMRFSEACDDCDRVFPDEASPVGDHLDPRLTHLLARLEHVYSVASASGGSRSA